jgi:CubicO group peptidase (beta-lactamase class C family)
VAQGRVPGVVAVVGTAREAFYTAAHGRRFLPDGPAMTADSVFWIASMTKAVTSTAAMQQVEAGRLALDEPIGKVLPELAAPRVLTGFDAAGAPLLRPATRPITLRHLLTHTAGFSYDIWNADIARYMAATGTPGVITCKDAALTTPLVAEPGERWEYGIGIDWAGKAVERVTGQRLGAYLAERITGPLGMVDTAFKIGPAQRARLVGMHARAADGTLGRIELELPQEPEFEMGGGGLYGTGPDYLRFLQVFLNEGRGPSGAILKPETVALMARNQIGEVPVRRLVTVAPGASNDAELFPGLPKRWGLAFMINLAEAPTGRSAGGLGWAGLANTYAWVDPARQVCGVVLTQLLPFADPASLALLDTVEAGAYRALRAG